MQANGWAAGDALFVDDSKEHIDKASPICRTLLVDKSVNGGMSTQGALNEAIRQSAGLPSAIKPAAGEWLVDSVVNFQGNHTHALTELTVAIAEE